MTANASVALETRRQRHAPDARWEEPISLNSVVDYRGVPALVVARAKPVNGLWRYDLLVQSSSRLQVVAGVTAEAFSLSPASER